MERIELYVALDIDRTLLDSRALAKYLCDILPELGISVDEAARSYDAVLAQDGGSLPLLGFFSQRFGESLADHLASRLIQRTEDDPADLSPLLYNGASARLLSWLAQHQVRWGLLTYGEDRSQQLKIELIRRLTDHPLVALITDQPRKAAWLGAMKPEHGDGILLPDGLVPRPTVASKLIIIDDKPGNLTTDHPCIRGILVDNTDPARSSTWLVERLESGEALEALTNKY